MDQFNGFPPQQGRFARFLSVIVLNAWQFIAPLDGDALGVLFNAPPPGLGLVHNKRMVEEDIGKRIADQGRLVHPNICDLFICDLFILQEFFQLWDDLAFLDTGGWSLFSVSIGVKVDLP